MKTRVIIMNLNKRKDLVVITRTLELSHLLSNNIKDGVCRDQIIDVLNKTKNLSKIYLTK